MCVYVRDAWRGRKGCHSIGQAVALVGVCLGAVRREEATAVWKLLNRHAAKVQGRDWRHSWTAMSFSSNWLQKLSIAVANQTATGALRRTTVCTRQRVLGGVGESTDGNYESATMGRSVAM